MNAVENAIGDSIMLDDLVEITYSADAHEELLEECDGNDGEGKFWGTNWLGLEWTVRLTMPAPRDLNDEAACRADYLMDEQAERRWMDSDY